MNERRSRNLDTVLAAAAAPPLPEEEDARVLANVLTMFHTAGVAVEAGVATTEPITALSAIESEGEGAAQRDVRSARRGPRFQLAVKGALVLAVFVGTSIAVASTGILPSPVQSFVHHMFGGIGVPGPTPESSPPSSGSATSSTPTTAVSPGSGSPASASAAGPGAPGSSASSAPGVSSASPGTTQASLYTLCTEVKGSGNSWKTTMSAQDQARLVAAAGGVNKVHAYCNALLKSGAGAAPSSGTAGGTDTVSPSPSPTKTKGNSNSNSKKNNNSASRSDTASSDSPAPIATTTP